MNWLPGPARCRSPEYEAEIAFTDMPGDRPILGRLRKTGGEWCPTGWRRDGRAYSNENRCDDLMPPPITREALAAEAMSVYYECPQSVPSIVAMSKVVAHVIDAVKAGRVE